MPQDEATRETSPRGLPAVDRACLRLLGSSAPGSAGRHDRRAGRRGNRTCFCAGRRCCSVTGRKGAPGTARCGRLEPADRCRSVEPAGSRPVSGDRRRRAAAGRFQTGVPSGPSRRAVSNDVCGNALCAVQCLVYGGRLVPGLDEPVAQAVAEGAQMPHVAAVQFGRSRPGAGSGRARPRGAGAGCDSGPAGGPSPGVCLPTAC